MRPIRIGPLFFFFFYLFLAIIGMSFISRFWAPTGGLKIIYLVIVFYVWAISIYRIWFSVFGFKEGPITPFSKDEFNYQIYACIQMFLVGPWIYSSILPPPIQTFFYRLLVLKIGKKSFITGIICDPHLVEIGEKSFTGAGSMLVSHVMEDEKLEHHKIILGHHVTVGAGAIVLAGCKINDYAIVAAQSLVKKNTVIGSYEIWGGVPAKKIGTRSDEIIKQETSYNLT